MRQYRRHKAEFVRRAEVPGGTGMACRGLRSEDKGRQPGRGAGQGPAADGPALGYRPALEYRPAPAVLVVGVGRVQGDGLVRPRSVGRCEGSVHFMARLLVVGGLLAGVRKWPAGLPLVRWFG